MSEVILSRQNGLGVKYIAKMGTGAVEAHYPKTIKLSIPSLTYSRMKRNYSWQAILSRCVCCMLP